MKMPTYEQQNEFLRKYVAPLFEFNLPKVLRNYRMSKAGQFTDERMAQIRSDVLAEIKEKGESYSDTVYDRTFDTDKEEVRQVSRYSNCPDLAALHITYSKPIPLEKLLQRHDITERLITDGSYFNPERLQQINWGRIGPNYQLPKDTHSGSA